MPVGSVGVVNSVGVKERKQQGHCNNFTLSCSWCQLLQQQQTEFIKTLEIRVTEGDIHHFLAQAKMASISEEFSGECFDYDCLSATCLGGLVFKREQKQAVSCSGQIFHLVDPVQHKDVLLKDLLALSGVLNRFLVKMYLSFPLKSLNEILKSTPQRWHASELVGFAVCFGVREEFFRPAFIQLN